MRKVPAIKPRTSAFFPLYHQTIVHLCDGNRNLLLIFQPVKAMFYDWLKDVKKVRISVVQVSYELKSHVLGHKMVFQQIPNYPHFLQETARIH